MSAPPSRVVSGRVVYRAKVIKALLSSGAVVIGLTDENLRRLRNDMPILFDLAELGLAPQRVVIAAGATREDITAALGSLVKQAQLPPPTAGDYAAAEWAIMQGWQGQIGSGMAERLVRFALDAAWAGRVNADAAGASVTCPRCRATSHNPHDVQHGYCGACHDWTSKPPATAA